jgi:hypothetical protein
MNALRILGLIIGFIGVCGIIYNWYKHRQPFKQDRPWASLASGGCLLSTFIGFFQGQNHLQHWGMLIFTGIAFVIVTLNFIVTWWQQSKEAAWRENTFFKNIWWNAKSSAPGQALWGARVEILARGNEKAIPNCRTLMLEMLRATFPKAQDEEMEFEDIPEMGSGGTRLTWRGLIERRSYAGWAEGPGGPMAEHVMEGLSRQ